MIASDGVGGAFVAWVDQRDYFSLSYLNDLYLQRVTSAGEIAPGWPADGLAIATGSGSQIRAAMLHDGSGGLFITYMDTRLDFGDLYLQRITAAGTISPGWPATGVPVAVAPAQQLSPEMVLDGSGGVFIAWRDGTSAASTRARISHLLGSGVFAPGWPPEGRPFEPSAGFVLRPLMLAVPGGAFLACWSASDDTLKTGRLLARRYTAEGLPYPAWPADPVTACAQAPGFRTAYERLVPDGTGGFYTIFADSRVSPEGEDLYAQHVLGSGAVAPGWPADGLPVSALPSTEQSASLCEDGQGGMFVGWEDYREGAARVFLQHLTASGAPSPGWPALGTKLVTGSGFQLSPRLAWDGHRGFYVAWYSLQSGGYRSYVQHFTSSGQPFPGWPPGGLPVVPIPTDQYLVQIVADGQGGAIATWEDTRDLSNDVYAQKYVADGVVATQVSVVSAEARADHVRLRWHVSGEVRASVERSEGGAAGWRALAQREVDGAGYVEYVDREVTPGSSYEYRLSFAGGSRGGETSVIVPALALALEGARPNPAVGSVVLAFTLPDASPARLELYDLSGRRLALREVGARGAGRHVERLDGGTLSPGLYWASLTHGGRTLRSRVAVVQ